MCLLWRAGCYWSITTLQMFSFPWSHDVNKLLELNIQAGKKLHSLWLERSRCSTDQAVQGCSGKYPHVLAGERPSINQSFYQNVNKYRSDDWPFSAKAPQSAIEPLSSSL